MAYKEISKEWNPSVNDYVRGFVADSEVDVNSLPACAPGSTAIATQESEVYIVNASGTWAKFGN